MFGIKQGTCCIGRHRFVANQTAQTMCADKRISAAVIRLVRDGGGQGQCFRGDVGR